MQGIANVSRGILASRVISARHGRWCVPVRLRSDGGLWANGMARIYISSTFEDLREYREVVYSTLRQLRHDVIAMEDYVATDLRPVEKCLQDVATSDVYVGIFAFRYGYVPQAGNPEQKSITELEYRKAGQAGVPRLVFLLKDTAPWPPLLLDAVTEPDRGSRIASLRLELKQAHIDSFFESREELARKVSVALQEELRRANLQKREFDFEGPARRFVEHMRRFAGARSEQDAHTRFVSLPLQATQLRKDGSANLPIGMWKELIEYPGRFLITGDAGSGKTTLLLYEAQRLCSEAQAGADVPLPIYVSLRGFSSGNAETLLEMASEANKIDYRTLRALWLDPRRPICFLLDGGDETAYREKLIGAIIELAEGVPPLVAADVPPRPELRSFVVACHPGPLHDQMRGLSPAWREILVLPLR